MKPNSQMPDDDKLDAAIRKALRVDAEPARVARLEWFWRRNLKRQLWARRTMRLIPWAAAAVIAFLLLATTASDDDKRADISQARREPLRQANTSEEYVRAESSVSDDGAVVTGAGLCGRTPTGYERFVLAARSSARKPDNSRLQRVTEAVRKLASHESMNARQALIASDVEPDVAETILLRKLPRSTAAEQTAILKLLSVCGGRNSIPLLVRFGRQGRFRDEVLETVDHIAGRAGLVQIARVATSVELQRGAILRLLASDSNAGLLAYLSLVEDTRTRRVALAAATEANALPTLRLVTCLDAADKPVRLAAARVLGHVNGPEITSLLIARVTERPSDSMEAWLALIACRDETAAEFLAYASHRPQLLGHLNNARVRWDHHFLN